jgi:hypothetical protein
MGQSNWLIAKKKKSWIMNKCQNLGSKGLQIGFPISMVSHFSLGVNTRPKNSAFMSNLGHRLKRFSLFQP